MASFYTSDNFSSALANRGIIHQFSAPYFPEQNGHAERVNRTLIEVIRTILHQNQLPFQLWGEIMQSAAHVYNLTTHSALDETTPYQALFGEKPAVNLLRPIGVTCHYILENTLKFAAKGQEGKLLGYHRFSKAYRIWNPVENKIVVNYNVKFDNTEWKQETGNDQSLLASNNPNQTPLNSANPQIENFQNLPS